MENIIDQSVNRELDTNFVNLLERHSMLCRCGCLASPITLQGHTFKCLKCERVYEGISYDFTRINSTTLGLDNFNEAINTLRSKGKTPNVSNSTLKKLWIKMKY